MVPALSNPKKGWLVRSAARALYASLEYLPMID